MNTSANFVLTALLGLAIFSESLPPLWWAGASLLVAGNVIIGRKDEGEAASVEADEGRASVEADQGGGGVRRSRPRGGGVRGSRRRRCHLGGREWK